MEALNSLIQQNIRKKMTEAHTILADSSFDKPVLTPEERDEQLKKRAQTECDFENNSVGNLNENDGYDCPTCKNRGYTSEVRKNEQFGYWYSTRIPCKCEKVRAIIRRLERSGLKNIIKDYTFDKYTIEAPWQKSLKEAAMKFCKDDAHDWFYLGGMTGSGKTHLCTAIAGYYLKKGKAVKYMLWRDDIVRLKAIVTEPDEYATAINELKQAEVMYVDDLFKTGKDKSGEPAMPTAADVNIAFEVLNYRYNNPGLITIISTERSINDLIKIDEAIAGRIAERSMNAGYGYYIKYDPQKNHRTKGIVEL